MDIKFYSFNWLTASAGVGLINALSTMEEYRNAWDKFIDGNTIKLPQEVFKRIGEIYANYITKDLREEDIEKLDKEKILSSLILQSVGDFFNNSVITNPSTLSSWKKQNQDKFKNLNLEKVKEIIKDFITEQFEKLLNSQKSNKTCFFCGERKAYYTKKGTPKVFGADNFTPLSASVDTLENFFYNGRNTLYLCAHCEIFLFFSAFGFTRTPRRTYLFVYVPDLRQCFDLNNTLQIAKTITKNWLKENLLEVSKLIESEKAEWLIQNVYFVEIEKVSEATANVYSFAIPVRVAKAIKKLIDDYPTELEGIFGEFLEYIYSEKNLYELLFKILAGYFYRQTKFSGKVNDKAIDFGKKLKFLNKKLLFLAKFQEVVNMQEREKVEKQINWAYAEGLKIKESLEEQYGKERAERKREGISYRILDAIRRRDIDSFQQNLIRAYLEVEEEIPYIFVEALKDENFNRIAYAFLVGLNGRGKESGETS